MISDQEIDSGYSEAPGIFARDYRGFEAGARFASRLERIKTLDEVQEMLCRDFHPTGGMLVALDRLIAEAKEVE